MDASDARRREITRQVLKLKRAPNFQDCLVVAPDGSRPIVIALPNDTVAAVFKVLDAAGGIGTVVVEGPGGSFDLIPVGEAVDGEAVDDCPVHPDTHVDMLVTYLRRQRRPVRCELVAPDHGFGLVREFQDN
jgi:hypothetical protein